MSALRSIFSRLTAHSYQSAHVNPDDIHVDGNGFLDFAPNDLEKPTNWTTIRRVYVTITAVLLVVNAVLASSTPSGCLPSLSSHFNVSREAAGLTITLFLLGYCAGPLLFAPLSEFYGRQRVFFVTFTAYILFNFLCAWAPNFAGLLVGRFLSGTFVAASLSNVPGVLADLWDPVSRGVAMAGFSIMVWIGPALGPIISGFFQLKEDWRWTFYNLLWMGGATEGLMFTLPETYAPVILKVKAQRIRRASPPGYEDIKAPIEASEMSIVQSYKVALTRPWIILFDPISFCCAIYMAFVYLLLYMLFSIYPIVFQEKRGWNPGVGELPLLGTVLGAFLGGIVVVIFSRQQAKKSSAGHTIQPEDRLVLSMIGAVVFAASIFWLSWTAEYK
ncbi:hypothetical protein AA0119_g13271 [Alternaria tenuissima]|uniref:Major facilitator superfamily (MFS) profile domain-containing protein n=2 Tax=Alternaria alternata complex TaxID=187734 RepID=A0A4Q4MUZ3_ALTAL|nr:hypothetical protein AA0117_g13079 [Alternaria alternata]RYN85237.1 hypothetical protein AA0119_g13271 [Alternaria tenuissima]RYO00924.1 hypothetical protein AA0121_g13330 [Alternaria tenuissima]RYO47945.1 hypothetical protein AA0116_g12933 [Alternaria tenuissima]